MERACCRRRRGGVLDESDVSLREGHGSAAKRHRAPSGSASTSTLDDRPGHGSSSAAEAAAAEGFGAPGPGASLFNGFQQHEVVRLLQQTLLEMGFTASSAELERESGVSLEPRALTTLRRSVLSAEWDEALLAVSQLSELWSGAPSPSPAPASAIRLLLLEQKCLEAHSSGAHELAQALFHGELSEAASSGAEARQRHLQLSAQLSCTSPQDLEQLSSSQTLRIAALWESVMGLLPPKWTLRHLVKPRRLSVLLWQAVRFQQLHCLYHSVDTTRASSAPSLLEDFSCEPPPLPKRCVARLSRHTDEVWIAAVSNDGKLLASSSKDRTVILWECGADASFRVARVLLGHKGPCTALSWSPDDQHLLTASSDCTVRLWVPSSQEPPLVLTKHTGLVTSVAWLPDCKHFVSAGFDRCVFLWDTEGTVSHRWELQSRIQDCAVTHSGSNLLVVDSDRNLKILDLRSPGRELPALPEKDAVTSVCASRFRDELLVNVAQQVSSLQEGPSIRLWDLAARRVAQRYLGHFQGRFVVRSCFAGAKEEMVISGSEDAQVYIWHRHYGSLLQVLSGHTSTVNSVCWTQGPLVNAAFAGPWLISAADDGTIRVWGLGDRSGSRGDRHDAEDPSEVSGVEDGTEEREAAASEAQLHTQWSSEEFRGTSDEGEPH
mmetsp:Transcript_5971/g.11195  ORF Transcript_5971/g.11195 Transcript_5971/m.11195 type:complete len:663 (-) Transcript_5971:99-2087(-)